MSKKVVDQIDPKIELLDTIDGCGFTSSDRDGVLLITCTPDGIIRPEVLRLGILSEGRLEMNIMQIYRAIMAARAQASGSRRFEEDRG